MQIVLTVANGLGLGFALIKRRASFGDVFWRQFIGIGVIRFPRMIVSPDIGRLDGMPWGGGRLQQLQCHQQTMPLFFRAMGAAC